MSYLGSWKIDDVLVFPVITHRFDTGALTDADAVPAYRVYEDETTTAILTGNTAKLDDANTTGFYSEAITLSAANGFEKGKCYTIYITAAVNSVTGGSFHTFQIEAEVDANRINWASVDNPTTALALTGTTIATTQKVDVETIKTNPVANGGTVTFPTNATLASTTNITAGTITTVTNLTNAPTNGDLTTAMKASVNAEVDTALADINLDHLIKIAVDTDFPTTVHLNSVVGHLADNGTSATFDRTTDSLEAVRDRGDAAWTTATGFSTHTAADVWAVADRVLTAGTNIQLPSNGLANITAWTVAITGNITGNLSGSVGSVTGLTASNLDATISSRASQTSVDTIDDFVDTEVSAIKAKTDNLPSDPADASDIAAAFSTVNSTLATIAAYVDTEVAAIKAKTDNLPANPAATSDIPTANQNADALLDRADAIEVGVTPRGYMRITGAVLGGKVSGAGTGTEVFRNTVADSKNRVTATVTASGDRTAITIDQT